MNAGGENTKRLGQPERRHFAGEGGPLDSYRNFAIATVATPPAPATSGTSLTVALGQGARFPTPPFNAHRLAIKRSVSGPNERGSGPRDGHDRGCFNGVDP